MSGLDILGLVASISSPVIWWWIGRNSGHERGVREERDRALPFVMLALPVLKALRNEEALEVQLTVRRSGPDEWTAEQVVIR